MEKNEMVNLERKIKEVSGLLAELGGARGEKTAGVADLLTIIHKPGWTTQPELQFVNAILDSMTAQAKGLVGLQQNLMTAAAAVGTG